MRDDDENILLETPVQPSFPRLVKTFQEFQLRNGRKEYAAVPIYPNVKPSPHLVWNSVADFVNFVRNTPGKKENWGQVGGVEHTYQGFRIDDIIALYDRGWTRGFQRIKHGFEEAVLAAQKAIEEDTSLLKDVHGSIVDVPTYLSGDPECMYEFREEAQEVLKLEVEVDFFYGGGILGGHNVYLDRGIAIMAAVMALRRMGVFVKLYTCEKSIATTDVSKFKREPHSCTIHVMNPDLPENLTETLMAIAHPAFNCPLFYEAQCMGWGNRDSGICFQNRSYEEFFAQKQAGKIVIPGIFTNDNVKGLDLADMGIDWQNFWSSPEAAGVMVKMLLKAAQPVVNER